ncbi:hypothetical protein SAMN02927900_05624 [Rhizobium mongolense subsp. loessense]|uniref:Uncharacterized protein n=1 Tax=Rhizobium mongolense subsp. loessense TaxID=158890 RepID=A0A1G4TWG9_9HYPH|nr:hypothetical protein SAMN02927900_05624 [Rhizobium mongolense subsp. loessense]
MNFPMFMFSNVFSKMYFSKQCKRQNRDSAHALARAPTEGVVAAIREVPQGQ